MKTTQLLCVVRIMRTVVGMPPEREGDAQFTAIDCVDLCHCIVDMDLKS